jgi:hypothetical protein
MPGKRWCFKRREMRNVEPIEISSVENPTKKVLSIFKEDERGKWE